MAVTIPAWLAWMLSAFVLNESYGPPCFGFGLIGVCMITFVIMFVPKSRQLSAIGKFLKHVLLAGSKELLLCALCSAFLYNSLPESATEIFTFNYRLITKICDWAEYDNRL